MWWLLLLTPALALLQREPPPPPAPAARTAPVEHYFSARLNQFDASNTDTFDMRFYYNDPFNASDHILVFVGGEWSISPGWLQAGLMYELAEDIGAAMFYTEHRYYGNTRPTNDTSTASLRWLSVDQALADLAQFLQHVTSERFEGGRYRSATVGLVGCSYAGSMAAWFRLAHPRLARVAFSDSGPLLAQEDFPEYLEVITSVLRSQGGAGCAAAVEDATLGLQVMLNSTGGADTVSSMFNTCAPLTTAPLDLATFHWFGITETFAYLVQYATPGDVAAACQVLTDESEADPVRRLAAWVTSQPYAQPCIEARYAEVVAAHTNTSYDAPDAVMRLWTYQTCVEFGWYQTTTGADQVFQSSVPLEYFHQLCRDLFGASFTETLLRTGIARTNLLFSARPAERVATVAGGADPWAPMVPAASATTPRAPVYVVPDVSHCRAVQPMASSETEELREAKRSVLRFMKEQMTGSGAAPLVAPLVAPLAALWLALRW